MKKVVILLICVLLLAGCGKTDSEKFKEEYESLNGTQNLINMTIGEIDIHSMNAKQTVSFLKERTGILYFGFPNCPWCRNALPVLFDVASQNNMTVFYFNPRKLRGSKNKQFMEIMNILDEYLQTNEEGEKVLYVPDIYFVKDGKIVGHHLGTIESQKNPTIPLTEEQSQELKKIYEKFVNQIK